MAKDKNIEVQRKQYYLLNTIKRKTARKEKRAYNKRYKLKTKTCPDCGGQMIWCCEMWSQVCCHDYGTCPCS